MVRHGADGQCFRTEFCCHAVDTSGFHFHAQDAVLFHDVKHSWVWRVEQVCGEDVTYASINAQRFSCINGVANHIEVSDSREIVVFETQTVHFRVGASTHADDHIT
ncbi:hypothetical protein D3C75_985220 [compost metagenome]